MHETVDTFEFFTFQRMFCFIISDIKESKNFHELLYLVLIAGNYLNTGNYAGDAAGFKLSSLIKLTETRANRTRINLMHFIVMVSLKQMMILNCLSFITTINVNLKTFEAIRA